MKIKRECRYHIEVFEDGVWEHFESSGIYHSSQAKAISYLIKESKHFLGGRFRVTEERIAVIVTARIIKRKRQKDYRITEHQEYRAEGPMETRVRHHTYIKKGRK